MALIHMKALEEIMGAFERVKGHIEVVCPLSITPEETLELAKELRFELEGILVNINKLVDFAVYLHEGGERQ